MRVRFWGTRGSIPKPGPSTVRYGGNTSCVEVRSASGTLVVLDCGTGALALGADLMQRGEGPLRGHLLISHTHWDHIQGLPFFAPLFVPGNEWDIYAPHGFLQSVRETLAGQMQHTYFPVDLAQLGATIRYHNLTEGVFTVGDITVSSRYLNHPALTLGYRLEADGVTVAYC
jgi:phosphoribosyl 1,2-cyclic phosphodiesterase